MIKKTPRKSWIVSKRFFIYYHTMQMPNMEEKQVPKEEKKDENKVENKQAPEKIESKDDLDAINAQIESYAKKIEDGKQKIETLDKDMANIDKVLNDPNIPADLKGMMEGLKSERANLDWMNSIISPTSNTDFKEYFDAYEIASNVKKMQDSINNSL